MSSQARVIANLVIGANGATSARGSSRTLSNKPDRERFHQLRAGVRAICIGGATYRSEPYSNPPIPLYVSSQGLSVAAAASTHIHDLPPIKLVELAVNAEGAPVLIEGGINFLQDLIENEKIDQLHITRSPSRGDENFFDENRLRNHYILSSSESSGETKFELWIPINQAISQ